MAQSKVSLNLSSADFVLSYRFKGQSVLIPGQDQNAYAAQAWFTGESPQRGTNIPQIAYCENTVPTSEGYRSVAYKYFIEPPVLAQRFVKILTVFDGNANSAILGVTADCKLFIVNAYTGGKWQALNLPGGLVWNEYLGITNTTIRGTIGLFIPGLGAFSLNPVALTLVKETFIGLDETHVKGICAARGYLIAWDDATLYWSSTENVLDFTPSLITGAGSAKPDGLKGKIVLCKEINQGFIIYSDVSILSASYTTSLALPWIFAVLQGGAGIRTPDAVAYDINMSNHFAWTSAGFIGIELHKATPLFPQLTDFIASGLDDTTTSLTGYPVSNFSDVDKEVRLSIVSSRYVCISFGQLSAKLPLEAQIPSFKQALLWDTQLKRWGKLNIEHIQLLEAPFAAAPPVFF